MYDAKKIKYFCLDGGPGWNEERRNSVKMSIVIVQSCRELSRISHRDFSEASSRYHDAVCCAGNVGVMCRRVSVGGGSCIQRNNATLQGRRLKFGRLRVLVVMFTRATRHGIAPTIIWSRREESKRRRPAKQGRESNGCSDSFYDMDFGKAIYLREL